MLSQSALTPINLKRRFERYKAPVLTGMTRTYTFTPQAGGNVLVQCDAAGVADVTHPNMALITLNISNTINVILNFPQPLRFAGLRLDNCNNVIVTSNNPHGVVLKAIRGADANLRALLRINGQIEQTFFNNVFLDCDFQEGMDAIEIGAFSYQPPTPFVTVQNCRIKNLWNSAGNPQHADGIQFYGGVQKLRVYNVDISTDTQGMFLAPQVHNIGSMDLENISIDYTNPDIANAYALYLKDPAQVKAPPISLKNVYIGERDFNGGGLPVDQLWQTYSFFPYVGAVREGETASFPLHPEITGHVNLWTGQRFASPLLGKNHGEIIPNAPSNLVLTATAGGFNASWNGAAANGASNYGYVLYYKKLTDLKYKAAPIVAGLNTSVGGLTAGMQYQVFVKTRALFEDSAGTAISTVIPL